MLKIQSLERDQGTVERNPHFSLKGVTQVTPTNDEVIGDITHVTTVSQEWPTGLVSGKILVMRHEGQLDDVS